MYINTRKNKLYSVAEILEIYTRWVCYIGNVSISVIHSLLLSSSIFFFCIVYIFFLNKQYYFPVHTQVMGHLLKKVERVRGLGVEDEDVAANEPAMPNESSLFMASIAMMILLMFVSMTMPP